MSFQDKLKALGDPIRREILLLLKDKNMSVGELGGHFDIAGSTLSYHLSQLKKAELIFETKEKNFIYYQLNTTVIEEIMLWFAQFDKGGKKNEKKTKRTTNNVSTKAKGEIR